MSCRSLLAVIACAALFGLAPRAAAQERLILLVVDPGSARVNLDALNRAIEGALARPVVRMSDERAQEAQGRLTIAFSNPNRWVLRYESEGQVAWVTDRILRPGELRARLSTLSRQLVDSVEGDAPPPQPQAQAQTQTQAQSQTQVATPTNPRRPGSRRDWTDDIILALQDEIVDPFASVPRPRQRPVSVLWSEVIDPFDDMPPRAQNRAVWSEVLDPWSSEVVRPGTRPRRRR
jgi:hypothetical protein